MKLIKEFFKSGCGCVVILIFINSILGAFCWPYTINTWLVFIGKEPSVVWWQGVLLGSIPYFGTITLPAAVITWILMLFVA